MDEQELQEFTLEDIIKEFGGDQPAAGEEAAPSAEDGDMTLASQSVAEDGANTAVSGDTVRIDAVGGDTIRVDTVGGDTIRVDAVSGDTVRMDAVGGDTVRMDAIGGDTIRVEPVADDTVRLDNVSGDTIRMDTTQFTTGQVHNAQPISEEEDEAPPVIPAPEETTEPYSEEWEPDYEQPIAEYVPPKPIIFHPRSKIRELKRKLVAGPEKQYYALSEKGVGKLQVAAFFCLLITIISAVTITLFTYNVIPAERLKFMVFGQLLAMLVCALLGTEQILQGLADLKNKRFSLNTLLCFTFLLCCADAAMGLVTLRLPCCAVFCLQMTMSLWSASQKRNTAMGQLDTMRKATHLYGLALSEDFAPEGPGLLRTEGKVEDFMDNYDARTRFDKVLSVYALVALGISIAAGVLAGVLHGFSMGIQTAAITVLAAVPATSFISTTRPMAILERRLHSLGAVICGWNGVEKMRKKVLFPITHEDLFPGGAVKLNGVKFFGNRESDQVVAYSAALVCADNGALVPIFEHLLESRNGIHYDVSSYQAYANGGIGGQVNGESVLVGTLAFLREMDVQIPEGIRVSNAVGISIDGQLCGLFALTYEKVKSAAAGLGTLCSYRGLQPTITSGDFMLTEKFLKERFNINTKRVVFPEFAQRLQLRDTKPSEDATTLAIATNDQLAPLAYCVTGSRAVHTAVKTGVIVHLIGGIVGMAMMLVLAFLGAQAYMTPLNIFLYQLILMVPGFLITEWTRSV